MDETSAIEFAIIVGLTVALAVVAPLTVVMLLGRTFVDYRARRRARRLQGERQDLRDTGAVRR